MVITSEKWLVPNTNRINKFNSYWNNEETGVKEKTKFKLNDLFDYNNYDYYDEEQNTVIEERLNNAINFEEIEKGEKLLDLLFYIIKCEEPIDFYSLYNAVLMLDAIYHTRLDTPYVIAKKINGDKNLIKEIENCNKDDVENVCKIVNRIATFRGNRNQCCYSFATKFCSRINKDSFPIYDSYAAGMLFHYLKNDKDCRITKCALGDYEKYCAAYTKMISKYDLENDYKKTDIFMWTYGKLLHSYYTFDTNDAEKNIIRRKMSPYNIAANIKYCEKK